MSQEGGCFCGSVRSNDIPLNPVLLFNCLFFSSEVLSQKGILVIMQESGIEKIVFHILGHIFSFGFFVFSGGNLNRYFSNL